MTNEDSGIGTEIRTTGKFFWDLQRRERGPSGCKIDHFFRPLRGLVGRCDPERWREIAVALVDLVPVPDRKPALVLRLALDAPAAAQPVLLAEYWHLLMAGIRHDPLRVLAVALDVWGEALSAPPRLLADTLAAAAARATAYSPWKPRPMPGAAPEKAVLDALAGIPEDFDFVRGWCLVRLAPILADAGAAAEALEMARGLSDRFDARGDTLRRLALPRKLAAPALESRGEVEVKKLTLPCDFGSAVRHLHVYTGRPAPGFGPLRYQAAWLREAHGATLLGQPA